MLTEVVSSASEIHLMTRRNKTGGVRLGVFKAPIPVDTRHTGAIS